MREVGDSASASKQLHMDERSNRIAKRLEKPMLIAAALTLPSVALTETHETGLLFAIGTVLNWGIWIAFALELVIMLSVVPNRREWIRHHPLEIVIVVLTPPVLPPALQAMRVFRLLRLLRLLRLATLSRQIFSLEGLRYAALLSLLTIIAGGAVFVAFEHGNGYGLWDGIYWAITTMTTLGSNITPTTLGGEITSIVMLLIGISFVAMLTGAVAQKFLGPEISETEQKLEEGAVTAQQLALHQVGELQSQLKVLEVSIQQLISQQSSGEDGESAVPDP